MTSPAQILRFQNLLPKKQFGQNFLKDPSTAQMIVQRSDLTSGDVALEIGAGLGALTVPIARAARKVYAVEKDGRLAAVLTGILASSECRNVTLVHKNILDVDINQLAREEGCRLVVFGNLPYNISSQILIHLIMARSAVRHCVLMFQKELALRIMAPPGTRDYGRLSVLLQYCAEVRRIADVKAGLFYPRPKVDSEVLAVDFKEAPEFPADDEAFFIKVVKAAFSKRRKTLKNALAGSDLALEAGIAEQTLKAAGIEPARRAETLSVEEFVRLSNVLYALGKMP
ncbi:MAG: 16S rRNA (adenine(1518)-N(6)/adenine(1519)-N(6))-dimethyltransferase RsmA [Thermodesulfobacteriota bacterium]